MHLWPALPTPPMHFFPSRWPHAQQMAHGMPQMHFLQAMLPPMIPVSCPRDTPAQQSAGGMPPVHCAGDGELPASAAVLQGGAGSAANFDAAESADGEIPSTSAADASAPSEATEDKDIDIVIPPEVIRAFEEGKLPKHLSAVFKSGQVRAVESRDLQAEGFVIFNSFPEPGTQEASQFKAALQEKGVVFIDGEKPGKRAHA